MQVVATLSFVFAAIRIVVRVRGQLAVYSFLSLLLVRHAHVARRRHSLPPYYNVTLLLDSSKQDAAGRNATRRLEQSAGTRSNIRAGAGIASRGDTASGRRRS